jgi:hypothetical protein
MMLEECMQHCDARLPPGSVALRGIWPVHRLHSAGRYVERRRGPRETRLVRSADLGCWEHSAVQRHAPAA